jgi:hypothetical protein
MAASGLRGGNSVGARSQMSVLIFSGDIDMRFLRGRDDVFGAR